MSSQRMGNCMYIAYIGFCKSAASEIRGAEHIPARFFIASVGVSSVQIFENQLHCIPGIFTGAWCGGITNISFHCVGECIHTCGSGDKWRKAQGDLGVKHCIAGDQREVIDGIFMPGFGVHNYRCQCSFASGSCSGWNGDKKWKLFVHFQDSFHLCKRLMRFGDSGTYCLGAVHTGASAEAYNGLTVIFMIKFKCLSHIHSGRICYCFVIKDIGNAAVCQHFFKAVCKTKLMDSCICNNQHIFTFFLFQHIRNSFQTADDLRISVWKEWKGKFEYILKNPTVYFF